METLKIASSSSGSMHGSLHQITYAVRTEDGRILLVKTRAESAESSGGTRSCETAEVTDLLGDDWQEGELPELDKRAVVDFLAGGKGYARVSSE